MYSCGCVCATKSLSLVIENFLSFLKTGTPIKGLNCINEK